MVSLVKFCRAIAGFLLPMAISLILSSSVEGTTFVVKVSPQRIAQVEARYTAKGYTIKERNVKRRYLVVAPPGSDTTPPPPAPASPSPAPDADTAGERVGYAPASDGFGNPTPSPGGEEPWLGRQSSSSSGSSTNSNSPRPMRVPPLFSLQRSPAIQHNPIAVVSSVTASTDLVTRIGGEGVEKVYVSPVARLLTRRTLQRQNRQGQHALQQHRQQQQRWQSRRHLQQFLRATATGSCPLAGSPDGTGWQLGNITEITPYAVKLAEADVQEVIEISRLYRQKVLFCIIDTGLDITDGEFDKQSTSGCVPNTTRPDGSKHLCDWGFTDMLLNATGAHGTHVTGTIAARRNGRGVVGMAAEGAQVYHYNIFGQRAEFEVIESIRAWDDCIAELDYRRTALKTPDMKLVISMSWGSDADLEETAKYLNETAQRRADVLFLGAAGNDYSMQLVYPAAAPAVVSVAAVDWDGIAADFSNTNADVEWAAGGVNVISTVPSWASSSRFITDANVTLSPYKPPADDPDILLNPRFNAMGGTGLGTISGQMVDCGLAADVCANAAGKVCLIQRGGALFCTKVWNCINGGGVASIIYGRDDQPECEQVSAVTLLTDACQTPETGWPITLTASRKQGLFLKQALLENSAATVTLYSGQGDYALGIMTGTSMATPAAAGVAGIVWSAHSSCTADELRAAISASAQDQGTAGRDRRYGFGIVKALAAHRYIMGHPCAADGPPTDCIGFWSNWSACNASSGLQFSRYSVVQPVQGSGNPCEAQHGTVRNKTCDKAPLAIDDAFVAVSNQWEYLDVVRNDIGPVAVVSLPSSKSRKGAQLLLQLSPERARVGSGGPKAGPESLVGYLSKPGATGVDTFKYTVADAQGRQSTARVTVNVTAGSCNTHACTLGRCSIGKCTCRTAAGMFSTWVLNPKQAEQAQTPKVPACRFNTFTAVLPFSLSGSSASSGKLVALRFRISANESSKCFNMAVNPIANATFSLQNSSLPSQAAPCPDSQAMPALTESSGKLGSVTCSGGVYQYAVKIPDVTGCYLLKLQLADLTLISGSIKVV